MTTKHATCDHPSTPAARAACRAGRPIIATTATAHAHTRAMEAKYGPRIDVHRPQTFDPEAYDFGWFGTWSPDDELAYVRKDAAAALARARAEGWSLARHQSSGQCGHCGARLMHYAAMLHQPSREIIYVGETCLDNRFEMATAAFQAQRKARSGIAARRAKAEKLERFLTANPRMRDVLDYDGENGFLIQLSAKLRDYAELSERQVEAAEKALTRDKERAEARAAEEASRAHLAPLTAGKRTITGTLVHTKWVDSPFGYGASGSLKGLIQDAEGYRFWGTIPTAFQGDKGDAISITATVEPKTDDPTFAFFKRPRLV